MEYRKMIGCISCLVRTFRLRSMTTPNKGRRYTQKKVVLGVCHVDP